MGRFDEVYRRSLEEPEAFWAEAAAAIDWVEPWERVLDDSRAPFYRWFTRRPAEHLLQRARPPRRARPRRPARADLRLARHRRRPRPSPTASCATRVARFAGALAAQGVERGDRVIIYMPMVPEAVIAMLACARHRRGPLGRLRRLRRERAREPDRRRAAEGGRLGVVRDRAGAHRRLQAAARRGDRARRRRSPSAASSSSGRMLEAELDRRARPRLGRRGRGRRAGRLRRRRGDRSALHPLHLGHDRPAEGHRPRQRRPRGRARVDDEERLRRRARRGVLGGVGRRLGRRPLVHRLRAAAPRLHDGALRGQAGRHARRRRVLARDRRARRLARSSPRRPRSARSGSRIPEGELHRPLRPLAASARSSSPASAAIPRRCAGPSRSSACR